MQAQSGGLPLGVPTVLGPVAADLGAVSLRPLHRRDGEAWRTIRLRDEKLLRPWDVTSSQSWAARHTRAEWRRHRRQLRQATQRGEALTFAIVVEDRFAGQLTFGGIQRGALRSGWVGYWVDSELSGHGVATIALALAVDYAFRSAGLHRIEATIAPANVASQKVVEHLGFRREGLLKRYLDIDGGWRDHLLYGITAEDASGGLESLMRRWRP